MRQEPTAVKMERDIVSVIEAERKSDRNQAFSFNSWVSSKHKYLCMTVPKVACSTVKVALHQFEGYDPPEHLGEIHSKGQHLSGFRTLDIVEILTSPEWFRFCFVRNPYQRVFSAYKSKVGNTWEQQYVWLQEEIRSRFHYPTRADRPASIVAFRDFLRYLKDAPDRARLDSHLNLQSNILMPQLVEYDFVGRFETFVADFQAVLSRLNAPSHVLASAAEVRNTTAQICLAAVYDEESAAWVYEMYRADFDSFGYDSDSWMYE